MFLHPQTEDAVDFANRVKRKIAMAGGLVDLVWDGNLKRQVLFSTIFRRTLIGQISFLANMITSFQAVKSEWRESQQEQFSRRIKVE